MSPLERLARQTLYAHACVEGLDAHLEYDEERAVLIDPDAVVNAMLDFAQEVVRLKTKDSA